MEPLMKEAPAKYEATEEQFAYEDDAMQAEMRTEKQYMLLAMAEVENTQKRFANERREQRERSKSMRHCEKEPALEEYDRLHCMDEEENEGEGKSETTSEADLQDEEEQLQTQFQNGSTADAMSMDWTMGTARRMADEKVTHIIDEMIVEAVEQIRDR